MTTNRNNPIRRAILAVVLIMGALLGAPLAMPASAAPLGKTAVISAAAPNGKASPLCDLEISCGVVWHNNAGNSRAISVQCSNNNRYDLARGQVSDQGGRDCRNVDWIYVFAGQELWREKITGGYVKSYDANGWHAYGNGNVYLISLSD
jgi:hypothetical protein